MQEIEPRVLYILGKHLTIELYHQLRLGTFFFLNACAVYMGIYVFARVCMHVCVCEHMNL